MVRDRFLLLLPAFAAALFLTGPVAAGPPDLSELANRIDRRLETRWQADRVQPAPPADDAEFLRRAFPSAHPRSLLSLVATP
jgi:hypothetical protein